MIQKNLEMKYNSFGNTSKKQMSSVKLNSLLEVTKAINNNISVSGLLEVYEEILSSKLNIGKLALYINNDGWNCILKYGIGDEHLNVDVERDLLKMKEIGVLDITEMDTTHYFEIIIPVFHKQHPLAYVLIGDIDDNKVEVSPVIKHLPFVQTLTNIIVVAIENKKRYKETIKKGAFKKELEIAAQMQNRRCPGK